jgi:hypothetical protein
MGYGSRRSKTEYLRPETIERGALGLLGGYARQFSVTIAPPIPVDGILESHLGFDLRLEDLPVVVEKPDALGAIWVYKRKVGVDQTLDPTLYPARLGRYRFTIGHETGHWVLHRRPLLARAYQTSLFGEDEEPAAVCRAGGGADPLEWQANQFAAYLLMPTHLVLAAWERERGSRDPYVAAEELAELSERWGLAEDETPTVAVSRTLAEVFAVSGQAMQIRLVGMKLIRKRPVAAGLLDDRAAT